MRSTSYSRDMRKGRWEASSLHRRSDRLDGSTSRVLGSPRLAAHDGHRLHSRQGRRVRNDWGYRFRLVELADTVVASHPHSLSDGPRAALAASRSDPYIRARHAAHCVCRFNVPLAMRTVSARSRTTTDRAGCRRWASCASRGQARRRVIFGRQYGHRFLVLIARATRLEELTGWPVRRAPASPSRRSSTWPSETGEGEVPCGRNAAFGAGETKTPPRGRPRARRRCMNDAFGAAPRAHATTEALRARPTRVADAPRARSHGAVIAPVGPERDFVGWLAVARERQDRRDRALLDIVAAVLICLCDVLHLLPRDGRPTGPPCE